MSAGEPLVDGHRTWGIARPRPVTLRRAAGRLIRRTVTVAGVALIILMGVSGTVLATTSSAHADIFGVSDEVEDWICGIVAPNEPWEGVGDGPESLISNRNLAQVKPVAAITVTATGQQVVQDPATDTAPDTMDAVIALPAGHDYTLYEIAGLRGLTWVTIPVAPDGTTRDCDLINYVLTWAGNALFTLNKTLLQVVISVKEAASADDPLHFLYDDAGGAIGTAFAVFFIPIATIAFLFTGVWVGVMAVRNRGHRDAIGAIAAGALIVILAGFAYLANDSGTTGFRTITATVDDTISTVNAVATNALFDGLIAGEGACELPADSANPIRGQRITSCVLADSLAYRPWALGQFGTAGAHPIPLPDDWTVVTPGADGATSVDILKQDRSLPCYVNFHDCHELRTYLIAQHGGIQIGQQLSGQTGYRLCSATATTAALNGIPWMSLETAEQNAISLIVSTPCSPMFRTFQVLSDSDQNAAAAYAGSAGLARITQPITALIGTGVAGVCVLVISLITMGWIAYVFALWMIGPFKLSIAVYRNKVGIAKEWAGDLIFAWGARLAYGILLSLVILVVSWMMAADMSFGFRLLWLGVILWLFWRLISKVQHSLRPQSSDAPDLAGGTQRAFERAGRGSSRLIRRAATGGTANMAGSWDHRRQLINDPTRGKIRRTVSALTTPLMMTAAAGRGAVTGPTAAHHRRIARTAAQSPRAAAPAAQRPPRFGKVTRYNYGAPVQPVRVVTATAPPATQSTGVADQTTTLPVIHDGDTDAQRRVVEPA